MQLNPKASHADVIQNVGAQVIVAKQLQPNGKAVQQKGTPNPSNVLPFRSGAQGGNAGSNPPPAPDPTDEAQFYSEIVDWVED